MSDFLWGLHFQKLISDKHSSKVQNYKNTTVMATTNYCFPVICFEFN